MSVINLFDKLTNYVANLGTGRDKASSSFYTPPAMTEAEVLNAYRGAWLPRKIVDIPALDATRKWRNWQADPEQITAIEAEEKRLGLRPKVKRALTLARLQGGSAILIGTGAANPAEPLEIERIGRGGLKYLTVLNKRVLKPGQLNRDAGSDGYGLPTYYEIDGDQTGQIRIHPSRLAVFHGAQLPDPELAPDRGWGDSVLLSVLEAVRHADATSANIASLVFEAKVDVLSVPKMMDSLAGANGKKYAAQLTERATLAATGKGINGMLVIDGDETYQQKSANFSNLPEILQQFYQAVAGAADIPVTRLLGMSPGGLNSTGDGDERVYYDKVQAHQELEISPAIANLDEVSIRSALGSRPPEVFYLWVPLRQKTEKEVAEIGKIIADTGKTLGEAKVFNDDVLAHALSNALIESGAMPGLEGAIAEFGLERIEEDKRDLEAAAAMAKAKPEKQDPRLQADAAPMPLYVSRKVLNAAEIRAWAKRQGFKTTLPASDFHVTITFSRTPVNWMAMGESWSGSSGTATVNPGGPRILERFGDAVVLLFASEELTWRHESMVRNGASWDHPEYQPHITLTYQAGDMDLSKVEPFRGAIELGPEIFEGLSEDWQADIVEE